MATGLTLAATLLLLALATGTVQVRGLKRLAANPHLTSTDHAFFRGRYRRRLLTSFVLAVLGLLIAGAYASGLERATDALRPADADHPEMTPEQRELVWTFTLYWAGVIVLGMTLLGLAFADVVATRRYWLVMYRQLREDHQQRLRRDLAVHKQQANEKLNGRMRPRGAAGG